MEHMQKYEVIRMIEGDGRCHISMDCVEGVLLIYRVQQGDILEKNQVLSWIRQLAGQLELYHRCGPRQYYRFLNPYSVLVTREERILLLDMEAESNEFVIRNLQKRAMRNHFVKPILQIRENTRLAGDLYSLGKTIQFLLACTEVVPSFSRFEEYRLSKLIQKCLSTDSKRQYDDLRQIQKDIPREKMKNAGSRYRTIGLLLLVIILLLLFQGVIRRQPEVSGNPDKEIRQSEETKTAAEPEKAEQAEEEPEIKSSGLAENEEAEQPEMEALRQAFLENTKEGNEKVIHDGELLKSDILYYLALAYDREARTEEAIQAYELLCMCQCEDEVLEQAYYRKAALEQENQQFIQAQETCAKGLEVLPDSEKLKTKQQELQKEEFNEENGAKIDAENDAEIDTENEAEAAEDGTEEENESGEEDKAQ